MKSFLLIILTLASLQLSAIDVPKKLIDAIAQVESKGECNAVGDKGKAIGKFQLWKVYVDEVNRICTMKKTGRVFTYEDRLNSEKSEEMVCIYLKFWGNQYERNTKQKATLEVLAKIHNGHAFWKRNIKDKKNNKYFSNLKQYWSKVEKQMSK